MKFGWTAPFGKFGGGGGKKPASQQDIIWRGRNGVESGTDNVVNDIITGAGKLSDATYVGNNVLDFTGVTGGGITDDRLTGSESVIFFSGSGTQPTVSAGKLNCSSTTILSEVKLDNNIWYVANSGEGVGIYDVNANDLFAGIEMVGTFEMKDYLEVL